MNSADTDGDIVATVYNNILFDEVSRVLAEGEANTIYPVLEFGGRKAEENYTETSDIAEQINSECNGFKNDIGTATNNISSLWGMPQDEKTQEYLKIMSVVDSLIIDFPKTSEKTDIPREIKQYMKKNHVKKQEFMMYLPANKKTREKEERLKTGEESLFRHDACTLNKICWHMRKQMKGMIQSFEAPEFDFRTLLSTTDKNIQHRPVYKNVLEKMQLFYRYQECINIERRQDKKHQDRNKDDYKPLYEAFYSSCRNDLILTKENEIELSKDIIIDCCILCCYTETCFFHKLSVMNLLWNMFPEEMVERARGKHREKKKHQNKEAFAESVSKKLQLSTARFEKEMAKKKVNRIKNLEFLNGRDSFLIYRDEVSAIKKSIPTSVNEYIRKRKLLYALFVLDKKMKAKNNTAEVLYRPNSDKLLNNSMLAEMVGVSDKTLKKELVWLQKEGYVEIEYNTIHLNTEKFINDKIDQAVIYFDGYKYDSGLRLMNRYLSK